MRNRETLILSHDIEFVIEQLDGKQKVQAEVNAESDGVIVWMGW